MRLPEIFPDHFKGKYTVPVLPRTKIVPVGYQPAIMRAMADGSRIPAEVEFTRQNPGGRTVTTSTVISFLDDITVDAFECKGRYLYLPKGATGLEVTTRPSTVVEGISVTSVNAALLGGDTIEIDDQTLLKDDSLGASVTWADIIAEGAVRTVEKAWIMFSSNGEGL